MIRIVGLSATLPNYEDVGNFLHVSPTTGKGGPILSRFMMQMLDTHQLSSPLSGLFHFNASFRPVPLEMQFIGVTVTNFMARNTMMAEICYGKVRAGEAS